MRELAVEEFESVSGGGVTHIPNENGPYGGTVVTPDSDPFVTSISREAMLMSGAGSWGDYLQNNLYLTHGTHLDLGGLSEEDLEDLFSDPDIEVQPIDGDYHLMCENGSDSWAGFWAINSAIYGGSALFVPPPGSLVLGGLSLVFAGAAAIADAYPDHSHCEGGAGA